MRETRNPCAPPHFLFFGQKLRSKALIAIGVL